MYAVCELFIVQPHTRQEKKIADMKRKRADDEEDDDDIDDEDCLKIAMEVQKREDSWQPGRSQLTDTNLQAHAAHAEASKPIVQSPKRHKTRRATAPSQAVETVQAKSEVGGARSAQKSIEEEKADATQAKDMVPPTSAEIFLGGLEGDGEDGFFQQQEIKSLTELDLLGESGGLLFGKPEGQAPDKWTTGLTTLAPQLKVLSRLLSGEKIKDQEVKSAITALKKGTAKWKKASANNEFYDKVRELIAIFEDLKAIKSVAIGSKAGQLLPKEIEEKMMSWSSHWKVLNEDVHHVELPEIWVQAWVSRGLILIQFSDHRSLAI